MRYCGVHSSRNRQWGRLHIFCNNVFFYSYQADLWALGILTYELCTGKTPFAGSTLNEIQRSIHNDTIEYPDTMSSICQDFISSVCIDLLLLIYSC